MGGRAGPSRRLGASQGVLFLTVLGQQGNRAARPLRLPAHRLRLGTGLLWSATIELHEKETHEMESQQALPAVAVPDLL